MQFHWPSGLQGPLRAPLLDEEPELDGEPEALGEATEVAEGMLLGDAEVDAAEGAATDEALVANTPGAAVPVG